MDSSKIAGRIAALMEGLDHDPRTKKIVRTLLENQASQFGLTEATTQMSMDTYTKILFPIIRRVWPNLIANYICSVQPMTAPTGIIRMLKAIKTTGGAEVPLGMSGSSYSSPTADSTALTGYAGVATKGPFTKNLNDGVEPGSVIVTLAASDTVESDNTAVRGISDRQGQITGTGIAAGAVNYNTGELVVMLTVDATANPTVTYRRLSDTMSPSEIELKLEQLPVTARTRKLKGTWSLEVEQDLASLHDVDAAADLITMISNFIATEIDYEIISDLESNVSSNTIDWTSDMPVGWLKGQKEWDETIVTRLNALSAKIFRSTYRGGGNVIICSPEVEGIFKSINSFKASTAQVGTGNPYKIGTQLLGTIAEDAYTIYTSMGVTKSKVIMAYRGAGAVEAGAYFCPYVPIQLTPPVYNATTGNPIRFVLSRYAYKLWNELFYGIMTVKGLSNRESQW